MGHVGGVDMNRSLFVLSFAISSLATILLAVGPRLGS
jgi:hypothetical protein